MKIKGLKMSNKLTLNEIVFIAILSAALGVIWSVYSIICSLITPFLKMFAIDGLISGVWLIGGVFFAYIIRKPGAAFMGEFIASVVEGVFSHWGLSAVIFGISQGLAAELVFLAFRYKVWNHMSVSLAALSSAIISYCLTYYWYNYSVLKMTFTLLTFGCNVISGIILGGLFAKYIADKLASTGVLNQFQIVSESRL